MLEVSDCARLEPVTNPVPVQRDQIARHEVLDKPSPPTLA